MKQIVILQRSWVIVGDFSQDGTQCFIRNGSVIRRWGTNKGLGQLAVEGPLPETVLDPVPETTFHEMTIVARIRCSEKWNKL